MVKKVQQRDSKVLLARDEERELLSRTLVPAQAWQERLTVAGQASSGTVICQSPV